MSFQVWERDLHASDHMSSGKQLLLAQSIISYTPVSLQIMKALGGESIWIEPILQKPMVSKGWGERY